MSANKSYESLKKLLNETVLMMLKNGVNFNTKYKLHGTVGLTIDDESILLIELDHTEEKEHLRLARLADEKRKAEADQLVKEAEIEREADRRAELKFRKRQAESGGASPSKRARMNPDDAGDDFENSAVTSTHAGNYDVFSKLYNLV